jgi:hypothetical protein
MLSQSTKGKTMSRSADFLGGRYYVPEEIAANSIKFWLTFLSTLLISTIFAACLDRPAFAQTGWLKGSWSYESNLEMYANRGNAATRLLGSANATQNGRIIEIGRINVFNAGGTLQGLVRDSGEIAWNFVYSGGVGGCNGKGSQPAEVTLDPGKKKLQIRVPWYSGQFCEANTPFIATLYHD